MPEENVIEETKQEDQRGNKRRRSMGLLINIMFLIGIICIVIGLGLMVYNCL
jgi:hypothetical protein